MDILITDTLAAADHQVVVHQVAEVEITDNIVHHMVDVVHQVVGDPGVVVKKFGKPKIKHYICNKKREI